MTEFSKKLLAFASAMYLLTWALVAATVFTGHETPWPLMDGLNWVYGASVACYCGKSTCENMAKIKEGAKDGER